MSDPVKKPPHYNQGDIECIDAIASALGPEKFAGYLHGNAIKYLWRCMYKDNPSQDLDKAMWYIVKLKGVIQNSAGKSKGCTTTPYTPSKGCTTTPYTPLPWLQRPETD